MKITKKQIKELHQSGDVSKLKEWFPSVLEEELEVGVWYKSIDKALVFIKEFGSWNNNGFDDNGNWTEKYQVSLAYKWTKATHQEIETALINEAKKRYKVGDKIQRLQGYYYGDNGGDIIENLDFIFEGKVICIKKQNTYYLGLFKDGTWATIIQPKQMTQEEIEKELGYKIEIV